MSGYHWITYFYCSLNLRWWTRRIHSMLNFWAVMPCGFLDIFAAMRISNIRCEKSHCLFIPLSHDFISLTTLLSNSATGTSDRHVTRGPEAVGGGGDEQGSELWEMPHWSGALPACGEDFPAEGAFSLLHGWGEPRICHDYWQAHWSCSS